MRKLYTVVLLRNANDEIASKLSELLNAGWEVLRADTTNDTIVYLMVKES